MAAQVGGRRREVCSRRDLLDCACSPPDVQPVARRRGAGGEQGGDGGKRWFAANARARVFLSREAGAYFGVM